MTKNQRIPRGAVLAAATVLALTTGGVAVADRHRGGGDRHAGGPPAEAKEVAKAAFTEADANGDGGLSESELASFHEILRAKLDALRFERLDADDNGLVSLEELESGHGGGRHGGPR